MVLSFHPSIDSLHICLVSYFASDLVFGAVATKKEVVLSRSSRIGWGLRHRDLTVGIFVLSLTYGVYREHKADLLIPPELG